MGIGKGTGYGISQIWAVVTRKATMGQLEQRSATTAFTHRLRSLLSTLCRIFVRPLSSDKTRYFSELSHTLPDLTPLSKVVDLVSHLYKLPT
jgi:hypothetical protein